MADVDMIELADFVEKHRQRFKQQKRDGFEYQMKKVRDLVTGSRKQSFQTKCLLIPAVINAYASVGLKLEHQFGDLTQTYSFEFTK